MTPDNDVEKLLGGFATNSLTDQERTKLFAAALTNQRLFDALADEQALKELLDEPRSRRLLIQALKEKQSNATWIEKLQAWFQQPWYQQPSTWAVAGGAIAALLAVSVVVHLVGLPTQEPQLSTDANPPVASTPDSPSSTKSTDLPTTPPSDRKADPIPQTKRTELPVGPMNKEEVPASAPAAPAEKKQQEQYAGHEQAPEPSLDKSFSGAGDSRRSATDKMTTDKQPGPEEKAEAREEARRFSPMAGRAVTSQDTKKNQSSTLNIRYTILREESEGAYSTVDSDTTFQAGDRVRLALEPPDSGYLYVLTRDRTGNVQSLFPPDGTGETARVEKTVRYLVPVTGAFTFEKPIDHRVTVLFSKKRLTDVLSLLDQKTPSPKQAETDVVAGLTGNGRDRSAPQAPPAAAPNAASVTRVEITLKHK